jgi:hypothetical protein
MWVFFGTGTKRIAESTLHYIACEDCGNQTLRPYTLHRYFHVFWIPVVPYKREPVTECMQCKNTLINKELPPSVQAAIRRENKLSRPPAYLFAGAFLIVLLAAFVGLRGRSENIATLEYLSVPMVNDYYVVDYDEFLEWHDTEYRYGVFKIHEVEPDSVRFLVGTYGYQYAGDAKRAIRNDDVGASDYFYDDQVAFSYGEMQQLFEERHLKKIVRRE